jgi:hypothetical protein
LERGRGGHACGMGHHSVNVSPAGRRYARPLGPSVPDGP